jgi:tetraacyldisaccharide 4'-kinase
MSWYKPENKIERMANLLLRPLSALYFLGAFARLKSYQARVFKQKRLGVPVISVGNLTVGGTGKTPIVIDLARSLMRLGLKVGICSRGYMRQSSQKVVVVSDGRSLLADAAQSGDEPYLIARSCQGAVVIVCADRHEGGRIASEDYGCDVIILDDGFQHLKLARNFDVVVYDYNDDPSTMHLLPSGRLREPLSSISRADCLVVSKVPENPDPARLEAIRAMASRFRPGISVLTCRFETDGLRLIYTNQKVTIYTRGAGTRVFAFCGIARPEGFFRHLQESGCVLVGKQAYADHKWLTDADLRKLVEDFRKSGARFLVTTEKDRVRLPEDFIDQVPLAELVLTANWGSDCDGKSIADLPRLRSILKRKRTLSGAAR